MKASETVIEMLKEWDVDHVYGYPGDSINNLVEELRNVRDEIQFYQVRHEEVATLAASAEAKLTGKVSVCLSIGGPGAIHLLNGMYDAKEDGAPMVVITGQISHDLLGTENFQEENLERIFDDVAVFNRRVTSGDQMHPLLEQAFRNAYSYNGVAVLSVPDDIFKETAGNTNLRSSAYHPPKIIPEQPTIDQAVELIRQSEKPVILAGKGAFPAKEELVQFAERISAPIIVSLRAKGLIPDQHALNLGNLGQIGTKPAYETMEDADLLLMVGTSFPYREFLPDDAPGIQIDLHAEQIGKRYPVDVGLIGSSDKVLAKLNDHLEPRERSSFLKACQANMENWWAHLEEISDPEQDRALEAPQVLRTLEPYVDDDAIISLDVGNVTAWTARFFRMTNQQMVVSSWLATMGCGLPGAIAAKVEHPEKQVVAICGDGGFSMVMQDFLTAVKYDLAMIVVIFNNEKIAMIKYEQEEMGNLPYGTDLETFNFATFAESAGGAGYKATNHHELNEAFRKAKENDKPVIIDAEIEDRAPLPGKIEFGQAVSYSKYLWKKIVEGEKGNDMPPLKTILKRLL
ncbi:pyruvate oxidase [Thalassobacillus sp. CUG 92003]|uniref:pyruvate oxidase n=1 Tax=Thalassobacillus sp. CUG 92003 TaxID=2736641 RepID=UPI0015E71A3A|nr:pyruvate oxidase [Thalassobacillus sp. CUG 92003]